MSVENSHVSEIGSHLQVRLLLFALLCCTCVIVGGQLSPSVAQGLDPVMMQQDSTTFLEQNMSAADFKKCGLTKLSQAELRALDDWFLKVTARLAAELSEQTGNLADFKELVGATIVANDGTFLGVISTSPVAAKSILNTVGRHGSEVGLESIFNQVGRYGGAVGLMSPFNEVGIQPPKVFKGDRFVGYLTVNKAKSPRIDPHALVGWLKSQ